GPCGDALVAGCRDQSGETSAAPAGPAGSRSSPARGPIMIRPVGSAAPMPPGTSPWMGDGPDAGVLVDGGAAGGCGASPCHGAAGGSAGSVGPEAGASPAIGSAPPT